MSKKLEIKKKQILEGIQATFKVRNGEDVVINEKSLMAIVLEKIAEVSLANDELAKELRTIKKSK